LRHVFGEECYRPSEGHACVIVDDPLLRLNYGFLNFECLLGLMRQHNFNTTIAFIPHNFKRSSPRVAKMFRNNADRLAICFHGNDHTGGELAATDTVQLNTMLHTAEERMVAHGKKTGLDCDRVMVFPQGKFSVEAMAALRSRNFDAAVNTTPHPRQQKVRLTLRELASPAVLRYGSFPLFLRKDSSRTESADIAFNLFFGRPILIVEHHQIFEDPGNLIDAIQRINAVASDIHWSNLGDAVNSSILCRRETDGTVQVRAFSRTVRIANGSKSRERFLIEWKLSHEQPSVEKVVRNGLSSEDFKIDKAGVSVPAILESGSVDTFSVVYRNAGTAISKLGFGYKACAIVRRRLSEWRDN
jgi:hypothetical protein